MKNVKYKNLVECHEINEYTDLLSLIKIDESIDLRENFIFRGLKKSSYDLVPSSLRKSNDYFKINDYILKSEFNFYLTKMVEIEMDGEKGTAEIVNRVDKNNNSINVNPHYEIHSKEELHFKREIYVLLKFLDYADKIGLKISASATVRRWIHNYLAYENKINEIWPKPEFYEIISLAQHHGLPTRALDWSYDFKVALYFAVADVLNDNDDDCVLWAFNYKLFEDNYQENYENDKFVIYRPEYSVNSNLKAQKGLFTFLTSVDYENIDDTPFDEVIIENLIEKRHVGDETRPYYKIAGFREFEINEKVFHKFIISGDLKTKILRDLYLDGYAYENIFPSYYGVVKSIRNRAKLDFKLNSEK